MSKYLEERREYLEERREQTFNPKTTETDESSFSASAKKFKMQKEILVSLGTAAHDYAQKEDAERVMISDARALGSTREERMARQQHQLDLLEAKDPTQGPSYGPGIDDTM